MLQNRSGSRTQYHEDYLKRYNLIKETTLL
jgi:hypothetical protein